MTKEAQEARRAYRREWARKNPDKVKAQQERHWQRVAEALAQQAQQNAEPAPGGRIAG